MRDENLPDNLNLYIIRTLREAGEFLDDKSNLSGFLALLAPSDDEKETHPRLLKYNDLNYAEKVKFLFDLVLHQLLISQVQALKGDSEIKNTIATKLPPDKQTTLGRAKHIKYGLYPEGRKGLEPDAVSISTVLDAMLPKIESEFNNKNSKLRKGISKEKLNVILKLITLRENVPSIAPFLEEKKQTALEPTVEVNQSQITDQINHAIDEYRVSLEKSFRENLMKLPIKERTRLYNLLTSLKFEDSAKQEVLQQFFGKSEPVQIPKPSQILESQLSAKYHFIIEEFKQLAALSVLETQAKKKDLIYSIGGFQKTLSEFLGSNILPKYSSSAATSFYEKIADSLKQVSQAAVGFAPLSTKRELSGEDEIPMILEQDYRLRQFIREVNAYHAMREAEAAQSSKGMEKLRGVRIFGLLPGLSGGIKLKASGDLLTFLNDVADGKNPEAPDLRKLEIEALKKGRLGKILEKYGDVLPTKFKEALEGQAQLPKASPSSP